MRKRGAYVSTAITSEVIALPREAIHVETTMNWEGF